ncbi:MAG: metallopeptidase family protein [Oscillospiraceae bacterium]|nr:metallopeptidase family protein [Oscillospiraceae bacterium]
MDIDGFHMILEEAAEGVPVELLNRLNGGILVLPEAKMHPGAQSGDLYIMGEYHVQIPGLGRYIALYYGSFERVFGAATPNDSQRLRTEVRKTLIHELRHHIESLSGVKDLEHEDERDFEAYMLSRFQ